MRTGRITRKITVESRGTCQGHIRGQTPETRSEALRELLSVGDVLSERCGSQWDTFHVDGVKIYTVEGAQMLGRSTKHIDVRKTESRYPLDAACAGWDAAGRQHGHRAHGWYIYLRKREKTRKRNRILFFWKEDTNTTVIPTPLHDPPPSTSSSTSVAHLRRNATPTPTLRAGQSLHQEDCEKETIPTHT